MQDTPLESTRAKLFFFLITLLFFSFPPEVPAEGASEAELVTIQLRWHHQFQFAGFYAAIEKGYYADEGLQVSLREFEPGKDRIAPVLDGRAHYGVGDPSLLLLRAQGEPVVVLAQIFQHNPDVLITLRRSDILSADQLIGKKIMLSVDDIGDVSIQAMILDVLGDMDQVVTIPRTDGYDALQNGEVDAMSGYLSNQPFKLTRTGVEVNVIDPRSYGIDFYGDNLFTSEQEIKTNPERVEKVRGATLKGWIYALKNKAEMIDLIIEKYNPDLDREQLRYEAKIIDQMIVPDLVPIGDINTYRYKRIAQTYRRLGMIRTSNVPDGFIYKDRSESSVSLTTKEQAWLRAHPDITLGFADQYEPFLIKGEDGSLSGILIDYLNLLNDKLGTQLKAEGGPWEEILQKVEKKELDGTLTMTPIAADARGLFKTNTQFNTYVAIFARDDAPFSINSLDDLRGKSVVIIDPSHFSEKLLEPLGREVDIKRTPDPVELMQMLYEGKVDAALTITAHNYITAEFGLTGIRPVHILWDQPNASLMGVRPDWPELVTILNKGIASFSREEINALLLKWINVPDERTASLAFTEAEKAWLAENHRVRVRVVNFPPYTILREDEPPEGISIDYLKAISKRTGIKFDYEVTTQPFAEFMNSMKDGTGPDLTTTLVRSPEREAFVSFSNGYLETPLVIFARSDAEFISDITGLFGKKVGVVDGTQVHRQIVDGFPEIDLTLFDSAELGLEALATGQVDAYIGNLTASSHIIHRRGFSDLHVVAPTPFDKYVLSMANRKDWPELTSIINKVLGDMSAEVHSAIQSKYMQLPLLKGYSTTQVVKWVLIIVGPALLIILMFVIWNRRLTKEVANRLLAEEKVKHAKKGADNAIEDLEIKRKQLEAIIENIPLAFYMKDSNLLNMRVNHVWEEWSGISREQVIGKTDLEVFPQSAAEEFRENDRMVLSGRKTVHFEETAPFADGSTHILLSSKVPLINEQGDAFALIGLSNDITDLKTTQKELVEAKDKAEAANRAKSVFLASMSHELRTPLSAILGFTQLMTRGSNLNKEQREWLDIIDHSGEHLLGMVDEILSLAKIESGRIELVHEPFDVVRVLEDIGQIIKPRARAKGLRFSLELDSSLSPCLRGDAGKIRQILINLLGNAVKFTSKGSVWLRARLQAMADDPAGVKLQLEVGDTGSGISREHLETIFDSFTQGDNVGDSSKGVGLGLAISRSLVDRMDGEIDVRSEQGKGSLFRVTIPLELAETSAPGAHEARIIGLKPEQPNWRILVVDDNRDNRALLTSTLDQVGFVSREAEDGKAAIEAFLEWQPHLIWMDMRMPVMDGCAATKKIRGLPMGKAVKIIAVTAHAFEEHRQEILAAGCDDLVRKPFREHEIFDAMARHLGVEYLRDDVTTAPVSEETPALSVEMLSELPVDILDELREATLTLNRETMLAIIEHIGPEAPDTANGLRALMGNFQMGRIGDLLRAVPRIGNTTNR